MINQNLKLFFPFLIFFFSYIFISEVLLIKSKKFFPNFIGKNLKDFIKWAKNENIKFKIYSIKNNNNIENLIITNQNPIGNSSIKKNSSINLEINLIENEEDFIKKNLQKIKNLKLKEAEKFLLGNGYFYQIITIPYFSDSEKILSLTKKNENTIKIFVGKGEPDFYFINDSPVKFDCKNIKKKLKKVNIESFCINEKNNLEIEHNSIIEDFNFFPGKFINKNQKLYFWHY